ncbi:MAG TPA: ATP-binding protein [Saprospiraceae bacterium]|nr:ATP-binding protein [Saprospiraceae bacterium]
MITRLIEKNIESQLFKNKVILITGPRQTGKTAIAKLFANKYQGTYYNCELGEVKSLLDSNAVTTLSRLIPKSKMVIFDEAQDIPDIGKKLKILYDEFPEIQIIATGSSSFDLLQETAEPLTGRSREYRLYPLGLEEIIQTSDIIAAQGNLENLLRFGAYPEVFSTSNEKEKKEILQNISSNYLYKDTLKFQDIRKPELLKKLLTLLALQIGNEVSLNKLSNATNTSVQTIERYLDILEKSFIIFSLSSFARNLSKEVAKSKKYFFYDLGIRNSLLNNYNTLPLRNDVGQLWENFCFIERIKFNEYNRLNKNIYFWRTYDQQEIDLVEEFDGKLNAFEFKFNSTKFKAPAIFLDTYEGSKIKVINSTNVFEILED